MNKVMRKSIFSVALGPLLLVPGLGAVGVLVSALSLPSTSDFWEITALYLVYGLSGLIVAYPAAIFFGLPVMLALRANGKFTLPYLLVVSVLPASILLGIVFPSFPGWLLYSYSSAIVALGCWHVFRLA